MAPSRRRAKPYGRHVPIVWRDRPAQAWLPATVGGFDAALSPETARRTERAAAAVVRAADRLPPGWEPFGRLLLRGEGIASSRIEGILAPLTAVAAAELGDDATDTTAAWIADNLAALEHAVDDAHHGPLTTEQLHVWHALLMRRSTEPTEHVGRFRTEQGWIGGRTPRDAAYVSPPPEHVPTLMEDLVAYANRADVDPITQAAVAHAQFETIHPYADGNGRIGRILVGWVLVRRVQVRVPTPVSMLIVRDAGGYLAGLHDFREGNRERYIAWFAGIVEASARATVATLEQLGELMQQLRAQLDGMRTDAAARGALELLPAHPALTASTVAHELGVSERSARTALEELARRGVVEPFEMATHTRGRPPRVWVARGVLDVLAT